MKLTSSVCLSARPSVNMFPQHLLKVKLTKKKFGGSNAGPNKTQNQIFWHILKFHSLVFIKLHRMIACSNVQLLAKEKFTKMLESKFGTNRPKLAQNLVFCHFLELGLFVFPEIVQNDSVEQLLVEVKYIIEGEGVKFRSSRPKLGSKLAFLSFF